MRKNRTITMIENKLKYSKEQLSKFRQVRNLSAMTRWQHRIDILEEILIDSES